MSKTVNIVWFKRDLRVVDHRPLLEAARRGPVLPLLIIEPDCWREADVSVRQYAFMQETADELSEDLAALGQPLAVRVGSAVAVLEALTRQFNVTALWSHEETGNAWTFARDRAVASWARSKGIYWHQFRQDGVVRCLADRNGWARRWDAMMAEPIVDPIIALPPIVSTPE